MVMKMVMMRRRVPRRLGIRNYLLTHCPALCCIEGLFVKAAILLQKLSTANAVQMQCTPCAQGTVSIVQCSGILCRPLVVACAAARHRSVHCVRRALRRPLSLRWRVAMTAK